MNELKKNVRHAVLMRLEDRVNNGQGVYSGHFYWAPIYNEYERISGYRESDTVAGLLDNSAKKRWKISNLRSCLPSDRMENDRLVIQPSVRQLKKKEIAQYASQ